MLLFFAEDARSGRTLLGIPPLFGLDPVLREGTRAAGPFTAIWYLVFMLPFALWVREPPGIAPAAATGRGHVATGAPAGQPAAQALAQRVARVVDAAARCAERALRLWRVFAGTVLGWPVFLAGAPWRGQRRLGHAGQLIGGRADRRWGPAGHHRLRAGPDRRLHPRHRHEPPKYLWPAAAPGLKLPDGLFFLCGALIGGAGGALQAAGRTMMVRHATPARATEAFGLYALSGKATAFLAPALIALATTATGAQSLAYFR